MTTPERINELLVMFNQNARLAQTFGMTLSYNDDLQARIDLPYNPGLDHGLEGVHGGVYMTLLDTAAWFTSAASHADSVWVATSEISIHLLKPVYHKALYAVGNMIQSGKRLDIAESHIYDEDGTLVGHGIGTFVVLPHLKTDDQ